MVGAADDVVVVGEALDATASDRAVMDAILALRIALAGAATRQGRSLRVTAVLWVQETPEGDGIAGCIYEGDSSPEVVELLADTLTDDSCDIELPALNRRVN